MATRKEYQTQYSERKIIGGVYAIRNTQSGRLFLDASVDLQGSKNRFAFARNTDSCVYLKLQGDWKALGGEAFALEVLEELEKKENQTPAEFKAEVGLLRELWQEKLTDELY